MPRPPPPAATRLRVAVLERTHWWAGGGIGALLAKRAAVEVVAVASVGELSALVREGGLDAVAADPELPGEGWPADVAAGLAQRLGPLLPVVVACRSAEDARAIEARASGTGAVVVQRDRLAAADLEALLRGEIARRRVGGAPRLTP